MSKKPYSIELGSVQDRFSKSRNKVQVFGGGFANGKTTALVIKALSVAKDYPGANMLLARSTYPKLNDTLRKVFLEWCPKHWIKSFPKTENTCYLTNGTSINFRYIAQQGGDEHSSSNLLSATYDFIGVDQMEDPEIEEKDFLDLLGRLRGDARYIGNDPTMPQSGPRWIVLTCNPARNWLYRKLIKPLHEYIKRGAITEGLLIDEDRNLLIDLFEGSTYDNAANLEGDFIKTLEVAYQGQMRDRFLLGKWAAYEGLVYPAFSEDSHVIEHSVAVAYYYSLIQQGYRPTIVEGYDYGLAVESCYMFGFVDNRGNVIVLDGFYEAEMLIEKQAQEIKRIRREYNAMSDDGIQADPQIFRRTAGTNKTVGVSVAGMFAEYGITMRRGNNDILNGITKIQGYINIKQMHKHPITGLHEAPHLYASTKVDFLVVEFGEYYWKKVKADNIDAPRDKKDHALDTLKYMMSKRPRIAQVIKDRITSRNWHQWGERDVAGKPEKGFRYG